MCFLLNHTACPSLDNIVPLVILYGVTPDISIFLQFVWYQKVYYKTVESTFPSDSPEEVGRFVGFAEHVGNALTYKILTPSGKVLARSSVRSAEGTKHLNIQAETDTADSDDIIKSPTDDVGNTHTANETLPNLGFLPKLNAQFG